MWQPIETAPKDGTAVLVLDCYTFGRDPKKTPHYVYRSAYFDHEENCWIEWETGEAFEDDSLSHWMHRVEPPEQ